MKLTLVADDRVRYEATPGPLTIEAPSPEATFSPFHMLGGSLASCTFSVLAAWAEHARYPIDDLVIEVAWTFAEKPHRVGDIRMSFQWPGLPASRLAAAQRAAALCTVHATLSHPPTLSVTGSLGDGVDGAAPAAVVTPGDAAPAAAAPAGGGPPA